MQWPIRRMFVGLELRFKYNYKVKIVGLLIKAQFIIFVSIPLTTFSIVSIFVPNLQFQKLNNLALQIQIIRMSTN